MFYSIIELSTHQKYLSDVTKRLPPDTVTALNTSPSISYPELEEELLFEDESSDRGEIHSASSWIILIVDDDIDVHAATTFALESTRILDRRLTLLHAHSAAEAKNILKSTSNIAVILLDVVMETNDAGLILAQAIRSELNLLDVRIILRTGQPGYAPELEVINRYDINDYKTKAELTQTRLLTSLIAAVRSYRQIVAINESRRGLEMIINAGADLLTRRGINHFAEGILTQIAALLNLPPEGMIVAENRILGTPAVVVAAAGSFSQSIGHDVSDLHDETISAMLHEAFEKRENVFGQNASVLFFGSNQGQQLAAYVATYRIVESHEKDLMRIFCQNISLANDNVTLVDRLHQLAYIDPLSHLPNRAGFIEIVDRAIGNHSQNLALLVVDIDYFGAVSETVGSHDANKLLELIGNRLRERLPTNIDIARIAGDAFGILGQIELLEVGKINSIFEDPIELEGFALTISVTTGRVILATMSGNQSEDIVRSAFIALKRAKEQRRGSDQEFTPVLAENLRKRTSILQDLRQAIRNKEFFLVYQPQLDLVTEKPIGAEALIRWQRANGELVPPDRFIDIAEHTGLILPIGKFVMEEALKQLSELRKSGYLNFRMAINVSMMQWIDKGFPEFVESKIKELDIPACQIELEITESVAMQGANPVHSVMMHFRKLGFQMALDDFGTGFSSLSYLQQLPVHRLKIDRSFVKGMEESSRNATFAETVVRLGQNLGLHIIAEGIENQAQAYLLKSLGCHEAQGYYYAKPMAADKLVDWLKQHQ